MGSMRGAIKCVRYVHEIYGSDNTFPRLEKLNY